jgi:two-component system response regulator HydG
VIERVGDNASIDVNVRMISATNRDLRELIDRGEFREDLFYRINVIPIMVPPLRKRVEDIPILAEAFFRRTRLKSEKNIQGISNDAMRLLMEYSWPGNVRELRSAFEYAFVTCRDSQIQPYHFPPNVYRRKKSPKKPHKDPGNQTEMKKRQLIDALIEANGNQSRAADILGISRVTGWKRMKKFDVRFERGRVED